MEKECQKGVAAEEGGVALLDIFLYHDCYAARKGKEGKKRNFAELCK